MPTFDFVTKTATKPSRSWSIRDIVRFHYFNPNGLCAKKLDTDRRVRLAVDKGLAKSGAIVAYGTFNSYNADEVARMVSRPPVQRAYLFGVLAGLEHDIRAAEKFLSELPVEGG